ncbi:hypothetical protein D3C87_1637400 [compost metagenome]
MLVLPHQVAQFALAAFGLLRDLDLAAVSRREVVEHRLNERRQRRAALIDRQRLGDGDLAGAVEFLLYPGQQMRLARADQAGDDHQPARLHDGADLVNQRALMLGLIVADPMKGPRQSEVRLDVGEHQPLPAFLKYSRTRFAIASRSSVSANSPSMKARSVSERRPRGLEI